MIDIKKVINFTELLNKFRGVERAIKVNDSERLENDVEHSYYIAMLAWYIIDVYSLDFDKALILQYALLHDFVEVYAGDTYIYTDDVEHRESKQKREREAAIALQKNYAEFIDMHETIQNYEAREDKESKFVYALDKVQPILNIYTDNGRMWREKNITIQMLKDYKKDKVAVSPEIEQCFHDLIALLKKEEQTLFNKPS